MENNIIEKQMSDEFLPDEISVGTNKETGLYHGLYYQNKPTPSGCNRFILKASTIQGYETFNEAAEAIEKEFPELKKINREATT